MDNLNHTTFKGDVAELLAASELVARGYIVSRPLTNGAAYDLLADLDGKILRLQVKRASRHTNGTLRINLCTSKHHRGRGRVLYNGRVDYVIAVDCDLRRFYAIGGKDLSTGEIAIRDRPSLNNQTKGTRPASDYNMARVFPDRTRKVEMDAEIVTSIAQK